MAPKFLAGPLNVRENAHTPNVKYPFLAVWAPKSKWLVFIPGNGKQRRPWPSRSSLIWVYTFCPELRLITVLWLSDQNIRIYNTEDNKFELIKTIRAKDVGWSVLDTAFRYNSGFIWATSWENLFLPYANNKGTDQPAHPCSLISAFVIRCLASIIPLVSISEILSLCLVSVAEQASLSLTWSQTPKTGFLVTWLIFNHCSSAKPMYENKNYS